MSDRGLPWGFRFSQSSLSDAQRCRRRFWLRYVEGLDWPGPPAADPGWEAAARRGQLFHQLIEQDALGLGVDAVVAASKDGQLQDWWRNWRQAAPARRDVGTVFTEVELSVPLAGYRLMARFDRVVLDADGGVQIFDWKTGNADLQVYRASWQSKVYLYVMALAGGVLTGAAPPPPERIRLCYWHAGRPEQPLVLQYGPQAHAAAGRQLEAAIAAIAASAPGGKEQFGLTQDEGLCRRCVFCSYCQRQALPAEVWDMDEEDWDLMLDGDGDEDGAMG